jgi:hypothetical protein
MTLAWGLYGHVKVILVWALQRQPQVGIEPMAKEDTFEGGVKECMEPEGRKANVA